LTLDVIQEALAATAVEMFAVLKKTAMSRSSMKCWTWARA
jgi:N-methylhydantoinase B/oxoprolinase/acetone carboxylase alpha subunit